MGERRGKLEMRVWLDQQMVLAERADFCRQENKNARPREEDFPWRAAGVIGHRQLASAICLLYLMLTGQQANSLWVAVAGVTRGSHLGKEDFFYD